MSVEIKIPSLGESVTEAVIARWVVGEGETAGVDDVIVELETDKAMMEVLAETAGVVHVSVEEGETVEVGAVIGSIEPGAAPAQKPVPAAAPVPETSSAAPAPAAAPGKDASAALSPAVRVLVEENNLDPSNITGTGKDGRLTKGDVLKHLAGQTPVPVPTSATAPAPATPPPGLPQTGLPIGAAGQQSVRREPMSRIRKKIAERLLGSQHGTASLTTFNEVDLSAVMAIRKKYKEKVEKDHGVRLGFMSFFSKAVVMALQELPDVNAAIDGDDVLYHDHVNLGIAVGTPRGLVVPVVKNAQAMSLVEIEREIARLGAKGKEGKITPDDMMGGTFTISNGGVYGSLLSTPILNPPQSGILGMHKIEERPMVVDGEIVIRPMMYLALTYDHRLIDGQGAVTFLVKVKERLEDPARMLLEV